MSDSPFIFNVTQDDFASVVLDESQRVLGGSVFDHHYVDAARAVALAGDGEVDEAREWIFGDALHSRPLPLNYGSIGGYTNPDNPAIYLAVASNDGLLRMIRNTHSSNRGKMSLMRHTRTARSAPHQWMRALLMKHLTRSDSKVDPAERLGTAA